MIRFSRINTRTLSILPKHKTVFIWLTFFSLLMGCAATKPDGLKTEPPLAEKGPLVRLTPKEFPEFTDSFNYDNLEYCILNSLSYLKRRNAADLIHFGQDAYRVSDLIRSLNFFLLFVHRKPSQKELNRFIEKNYHVYRSVGKTDDGKVLFTGYYEPFLSGSPVKTKAYPYPVYSMPNDLITIDLSDFSKSLAGKRIIGRYNGRTIVPYDSRAQIETNPDFARKAPPIAWVNDRVDLFFLHIQGSGQIHMTNGKTINVHYHGVNGRAYKSIGKLLIDRGKIKREEMSMQKIRSYLKAHPEDMEEILHYNSSYVFFKTEKQGPLGCLGVPLTPARSAAFDRKTFPAAALAFISTQIPTVDGNMAIAQWNEYKGFVLNQDTGGAIKGPGRADLFWGSGPYAEVAAGHLKSKGELYFLILKPQSL